MKEIRCQTPKEDKVCNKLLLKYEGLLTAKVEIKCANCKKITTINK